MDDFEDYSGVSYGLAETCYLCMSCCCLISCPCSIFSHYTTIQDYERGVKLRFGKRTHSGVLQVCVL